MAGGRWWRAYADARHDPKLQRLGARLFKQWFHLLCLCSISDGRLPNLDDIAFDMRTSRSRAQAIIDRLVARGLIDKNDNGYKPHNWDGRQYKSDRSAERMRRHRERHRDVTVTPPEQTEQIVGDTSVAANGQSRKGTRLADSWLPDENDLAYAQQHSLSGEALLNEIEKFRNFWCAKVGRDARKLDWHRTWQNWVLTARPVTNKPKQTEGFRW